ncbi:TetR/AcrR family transcriptional regulator [Halomarina oriensis]|uniref:TetR family transcriptional regulator n=1 Tax=Halomarina oriensis TaxID=671145 RepID=A0A6B0GHW0_9EURY|nr:TetR/AcrR family transcriptional regulator [Halomarina oriensis]MWG33497.1 TetR family transcriptional regulator [Halomarina oriensis]
MRSFSESERSRIHRQIRETGRKLFARYGLRKTTISELTTPAGIAASTFYQFYDSKEELYLELLEAEGEEIAERLLAESFERYDDPERAIEAFLLAVMEEIETNPLVHQLMVGDDFEHLRAEFSEEEWATEQNRDIEYYLPYVEAWFEAGRIEGPSPEVVAHAVRSLAFLTLHEEDIPMYHDVKETLVSAVARGLVAD